MSEEKKIFTLKQVAFSIQKAIQERYSQTYWVQAEMHKLNYTPKGHCYPELVHKEDGKIVAEIRGTIWKTQYDRISENFFKTVKEPIKDGLTLLFLVKISYHPVYGMGLEVLDIDPTFTLGELHKEREETLLKLTKEGVINANQLLPFPLLPKRIAVISVASSKGLSDFYSVIHSNPWNYEFFFHLFSAQLNGDGAISSIQYQLKRIQKFKHLFDCVVIIRGGGGEIGLSCYNNYDLAKAIATFPLPVLTGIGHSTNVTVCEMVAYQNAITPTELADFLIQAFHNFSVPVKEAEKIIGQKAKELIALNQQFLQHELRVFKSSTFQWLNASKTQLKGISKDLDQKAHTFFYLQKNEQNTSSKRLFNGVKFLHVNAQMQLNNSVQNIQKSFRSLIDYQDKSLEVSKQNLVVRAPKFLNSFDQQLFQIEKTIRLVDPQEV
ncbi:MAG: exodeoxyribonuclease VII large subunit, partial [Crocinitomicaceae bacterium]|nr:exodeoxyribonuclease VII large subunit [Crocinitomicaceae bacterium]